MIATRLTQAFGLTHPIVLAPMAGASGGALAAAVSHAGGLGLIGGGYCDAGWIDTQFAAAGNAPVGCGFITWKLGPDLLEHTLARKPRAVFLSFGDLAPFAPAIHAANVPLIAQVQTAEDARAAIDHGATVIAAQGAEAGGHGARRATLTLVPEVADLIATRAPDTLLLAAGGIADGRGLAAALLLGADGALVGSRFWAATEALVHENFHAAAIAATGDHTLRTRVPDVARGLAWPAPYDIRVLQSGATDRWHDAPAEMTDAAAQAYRAASEQGDAQNASAIIGEAVGLIHDIRPAAQIIETMSAQAETLLGGGWRKT